MLKNIQDWLTKLRWRSQLYLITLGYLVIIAVSYLFYMVGLQTAVSWDRVLHFCVNCALFNLVIYIAVSVLLNRADEERYLKEFSRRVVLAYPLNDKRLFLKELHGIISEETKQEEARLRETDEEIREFMAQIKH